MSERVLFTWLGITDLRAATGELGESLGPIGQAVKSTEFDHVCLLSDHEKKVEKKYSKWLGSLTEAEIKVYHNNLSSPMHFEEIYEAVLASINALLNEVGHKGLNLIFHISPGTPAMAAVWIILAKTSHPAELIQSSIEKGVQTVSFPFDISADYLPHLSGPSDDEIMRLTQGLPPEAPEFSDIIYRSKEMKNIVARARRIAIHDVPILIQGESGTGKELFARAIHASSPRQKSPFIPVNCGAIPSELIEAEFFGHTKGAFTGATQDRIGYLEAADKGTLFLDEIGELPPQAQVKLLRSLQDGIIQKVGSTKTKKIDIRIIAASNKNLLLEISVGNFREDLFHRLAVGVLHLPPLRERKGDMNLLIDHILGLLNTEFSKQPDWKHKNISASTRNLMQQHLWPGNIRELYNTLCRAAVWSSGLTIQAEDIREALLPVFSSAESSSDLLGHDISEGIDLQGILSTVINHYLERALEETNGNKTKAAKLLGLPSYQTLTNWMKKYYNGKA